VRKQGVSEALKALVGERIGIDRRTKQRDADLVAERMVAVFPVVQKAYAKPMLREVDETMRGHFELRLVPGRIAMRRSSDDTVRAFENGGFGANGEREVRLEQNSPLVPVDIRLELDARGIRP
jgi:hypothetical protein